MNNKKKFDLKLYLDILHNKKNLKTVKRNGFILPEYIDKIIYVYNGITFKKIKITDNMVGTKFGQYCPSRKIVIHKKKNSKWVSVLVHYYLILIYIQIQNGLLKKI